MESEKHEQKQPVFSIILPFYKQEDHAKDVVGEFQKKLETLGDTFEIIVIINGVQKLTEESSEKIISFSPRIIQHSLQKAGWGRAVNWGIAQAKGKYICYTNSARTSGDELIRLLKYAKVSEDAIVKATRIERSNILRKWVSVFYNIENRLVLKTPIWDVNATPKIIPKQIMDTIKLESMGDSIDAELMFKAFQKNIPIIEIPIRQSERKSGKSTTNWNSAMKMFLGVLELKKHAKK
jgi:hypothetical protein